MSYTLYSHWIKGGLLLVLLQIQKLVQVQVLTLLASWQTDKSTRSVVKPSKSQISSIIWFIPSFLSYTKYHFIFKCTMYTADFPAYTFFHTSFLQLLTSQDTSIWFRYHCIKYVLFYYYSHLIIKYFFNISYQMSNK